MTPLLTATANTYFEFEDFTVWSGFEVLAPYLLQAAGAQRVASIVLNSRTIGYRYETTAIVFKRRIASGADQRSLARDAGIERLILLTDKYQWVETRMIDEELRRVADGRKPEIFGSASFRKLSSVWQSTERSFIEAPASAVIYESDQILGRKHVYYPPFEVV